MTFVSKWNGGNIYIKWWFQFTENASTAKVYGSGFHEAYFSVCLLIGLANKSISGVSKMSNIAMGDISGFNWYSVASWNLEFLSVSKLSLPGMCAV